MGSGKSLCFAARLDSRLRRELYVLFNDWISPNPVILLVTLGLAPGIQPPVTLGEPGHIGEGEGAEASGGEDDGKKIQAGFPPSARMTARSRIPSQRPRSFGRLTAPRAVILELARESRGTKSTALGIYTTR